LGFLAKGPVAWLPYAGLLLARWLRPNQFKFPVAKTILGLLLTLLVVATWGLPALMRTRGQFFSVGIGHHVIFRSFGIMEGHGLSGVAGWLGLLPLYFGTFFFSFFPWSLRVPRALKWWWPQRGQDLLGWYLFLQIALVFAVFTLVRTKLPHYTLPAFPAIAFWLALRVTEERRDDSDWVFRRVELMCLLLGLVTLGLFPFARPYFASATLWHKAEPFCSAQSRLATIDFDEPSLVWEFRKGVTYHMEKISLSEAADFLKKPSPRILILPTQQFNAELRDCARNAMVFRSAGINTASLRRIDLTTLVKPEE
jgi:4-amino-4-deoxy-L-arabinose transferase-like glycosyltransferase